MVAFRVEAAHGCAKVLLHLNDNQVKPELKENAVSLVLECPRARLVHLRWTSSFLHLFETTAISGRADLGNLET